MTTATRPRRRRTIGRPPKRIRAKANPAPAVEPAEEDKGPQFVPIPAYRPAASTAARYRVIYGGAGSGKSVFVAMDCLHRCKADGRERILVIRKVYRTCRNSTFKLFTDLLRDWGWDDVETSETGFLVRFPNGAEIIHAGVDDPEKLKSITGVTRIWVEEGTELDFYSSEEQEDDLAQIDLRLRGVPDDMVGQVTITFNPTKAAAKLFDYVGVATGDLPTRTHKHFDRGRVYVQHSTYLDNPHVGESYVDVFRRLGGVMAAVYERGELVSIDAPDQLIKWEWLKAAFERSPDDPAAQRDGRGRIGCDPARYGDDVGTIVRTEGFVVRYVERHTSISTTALGRRVASLAESHSVSAELVAIDDVGLGAGTLDACRDEGIEAQGFTAGASPKSVDELPSTLSFNNLRSQAWFFARHVFQSGEVSITLDGDVEDVEHVKQQIQEDLLGPKYRTGQEKRIEVEPKEGKSKTWGLKTRLGRSPDVGDALVMALFAEFVADDSGLFYYDYEDA